MMKIATLATDALVIRARGGLNVAFRANYMVWIPKSLIVDLVIGLLLVCRLFSLGERAVSGMSVLVGCS